MPLLYLENPAGGSRGPLAHDGEVLMLPIRVHAREPPTPPTDDPIIPSPSPPLIRSPASLRTVTRLVPSHQRPIRIQANRRTAIRALTPLPTASRMFLLLATRRLPPSQWPWAGGGPFSDRSSAADPTGSRHATCNADRLSCRMVQGGKPTTVCRTATPQPMVSTVPAQTPTFPSLLWPAAELRFSNKRSECGS